MQRHSRWLCCLHPSPSACKGAYLIWLGGELGLQFSEEKRQHPGQLFRYTGLLVDTVRGLLFVPDDKLPKIVADLRETLSASSVSLQFCDHVRGRLQHYSAGLKYVRVYAAAFLNCGDNLDKPGASARPDYLIPSPVLPFLHEACRHLLWVIDRYHSAGSDLWPPVPSSFYRAFFLDEDLGHLVLVATWDASPAGWSAVVRSNSCMLAPPGQGPFLGKLNEVIQGTTPCESVD